jgi:tetratricopeptide (TPR) repeat protein
MSVAVGIGLVVLGAALAIALATAWFLREPRSEWPPELIARRDALRERVRVARRLMPARPALADDALPVHPAAATLEAKLLAGDRSGALAVAERALAARPDDPVAHVLLARALVARDDLEPAARALLRADELGAAGAMLAYVRGRVRLAALMRATGTRAGDRVASPAPLMITPFEVFVLQLERQRQVSARAAAVWLAGLGDHTLDHDRILAVVTEHFTGYYAALADLLEAVELAPGFAEALYHLGRLALKVGFVAEGYALLEAVEPLMEGCVERQRYQRDLAQLRDGELAAQVAALPAIGDSARRSPELRVLP